MGFERVKKKLRVSVCVRERDSHPETIWKSGIKKRPKSYKNSFLAIRKYYEGILIACWTCTDSQEGVVSSRYVTDG